MKASFSCIFALLIAMSIICISGINAQQAPPAFADVNKILEARCVKCHSGTRPPDGLYLDSYKGLMTGAKGGPIIVKGEPVKSELVKRIKGVSKPRMPKDGPPWLSDADITLIEKWIAAGAAE